MTRLRAVAALSLLLLLATACSSSDQSEELVDREFWSTGASQNGEPFSLVDGTRITLRFDEGSIRANAGCNSIGGTAELEDGTLRTTDLSMTEMGCDPERHAQDDFVIRVLSAAPAVTVDGDTLRLETADAAIDFLDATIANPALPLEGTLWEIDGFLSGGTASSFATDVQASVRIQNDTMQLFDGCAEVELAIEIADDQIRFQPVGMPPAQDCDAPPGYRQSVYTAFSRGALAYTIDGTNLTLATPDNVGFTLRAAE